VPLTNTEFGYFQRFIYDTAGIFLPESKKDTALEPVAPAIYRRIL
jgi:hypothetical protein